jgi:hypothetical protein
MSPRSLQPLAYPLYRMIDISPDLAIIPCPGMVVKRVSEDQCALFLPGASAIDGSFLIDRPWDEVVDEINGELERAVDEAAGLEDEGEGDEGEREEE